MKKLLKKLPTLYERSRLRSRDFVIISNNCWGFECYRALNREYNTPFVGLFFYPADYLKLLRSFEKIGSEKLRFVNSSKQTNMRMDYPIGVILEDVEIHFLHFADEVDARTKWMRRLARMEESISRGAELLFKMCDRDGCTEVDLNRFHSLPLIQKNKRVSFGVRSLEIPHHICVEVALREPNNQVVDGLQLYRKRYRGFDFAEWVVSGTTQPSLVSGVLSRFA